MRRALALARRGGRRVRPNPQVGCVIERGGRVIAESYHARFGGPHAERRALRLAGARAKGATAYVTLEPCPHHGKTPPCTEALIGAGVRRIVAAMRDPDARARGKGLAALKRAGLRVSCGLLSEEARELNRTFCVRAGRGRPYVILKAGASLDGRLEDSRGVSRWITSAASRRLARRMRAEADALLVGVGTVLKDDPRLSAPGARPLRVILDSRLRTPRSSRVLRGPAPTLIVTAKKRGGYEGRNVSLLRVPRNGKGLDLEFVLAELAKRGVSVLFVEGGPRVHTAFLEKGLVDELRLFLSPRLLGGEGARGFFEGRGLPLAEARPLSRLRVRRVGPDLLVTGRFAQAEGR